MISRAGAQAGRQAEAERGPGRRRSWGRRGGVRAQQHALACEQRKMRAGMNEHELLRLGGVTESLSRRFMNSA